jgi:dethiobiotin synthetase
MNELHVVIVSKGIFIIGTDTNVGKTLISASLGWKLSKKINKICMMKPFATGNGVYSKTFRSEDVAMLHKSIYIDELDENINPYYFPLACSPYMAAELLQMEQLDLDYALKKYEYLRGKYEFLILEGIGGLLVPLNSNSTLLDFIKLTKLEVIIVSTPFVGTLNHTMLTVKECKSNGISIRGIIVNKMPMLPNLIESRTPSFIEKLTMVPVIGVVPYLESFNYTDETFKTVSEFINF